MHLYERWLCLHFTPVSGPLLVDFILDLQTLYKVLFTQVYSVRTTPICYLAIRIVS